MSLPATSSPGWDYSALAAHYEQRAPYHPDTAATLLRASALEAPARIADFGAGSGRVAIAFAVLGCRVDAIEPCAAMRAIGQAKSRAGAIDWHDARGESTGLSAACYDLVSFGSSLNVMHADLALAEAARLLVAGGALAVLYNHRDLDDPLQRAIEAAIRRRLPEYAHGSRREDPRPVIEQGGLFEVIEHGSLAFGHRLSAATFAAGFRAHATLQRQAGGRFEALLAEIATLAADAADTDGRVEVPFATRWWMARRR